MSLVHGIDTSYAKGTAFPYDLALAQGHAHFVICRATFGSNPEFDDGASFVRGHDECKRLGIPFGPYHFFLFGHDGAAQAQHFLETIDGRYGELRAMVDVEEQSGTTGDLEENIAELAAFNRVVEAALGAKVLIYTNADTWDSTMGGTDAFSGHGLVVASYGEPAGCPIMPQGWSTFAAHQFTSTGQIDGYDGNVDFDFGYLDMLRK